MSSLDVLFLPYSDRNPYQHALAKGLASWGVTCRMGRGVGRLPILGAVHDGYVPDVLHLHWIHPYLVSGNRVRTILKGCRLVVELLLVSRRGIRTVWTVHNLMSHDCPFPQIEAAFKHIVARRFDRVIVHCPGARQEVLAAYRLEDVFGDKVRVIPHGNYIDCYPNKINRTQARRRLGLASESVVLLFFGEIRPYKGVFDLIKTAEKLNHPRVRLVVAGRPQEPAIEAKLVDACASCSQVTCYPGFVPDDEVQVYMNTADVVVFPYREILTSGAVILAMSFGKAVIAPRVGCIPDTVPRSGGFLYDPNGPSALEDAVLSAIDADLAEMGACNRRAIRDVRWTTIGEQTRAVYDECFR